MSLQMTHCIPFYGWVIFQCVTAFLSTHLLMDIQVASVSWLSQIVLQWILGFMCLFELWFSQGMRATMYKMIVNGNLLCSTGAQLRAPWWPPWVYIGGMGLSRAAQEGEDICIHIWVGKTPRRGNGYPLQRSRLKSSMDWGAWQAPWGHKELDMTEQLTHHSWFTSLYGGN